MGVETLALRGQEAEKYWHKVQRQIRDLDLGDRVHCTGYIDAERASRSLSGSDIRVLPSRAGDRAPFWKILLSSSAWLNLAMLLSSLSPGDRSLIDTKTFIDSFWPMLNRHRLLTIMFSDLLREQIHGQSVADRRHWRHWQPRSKGIVRAGAN